MIYIELQKCCFSFFEFYFEAPKMYTNQFFFFLSEFSFTDTDDSQDSRGREGTIFYSTLPLPPAHEHSDFYLQLCMWDDYHNICNGVAMELQYLQLYQRYASLQVLFNIFSQICSVVICKEIFEILRTSVSQKTF